MLKKTLVILLIAIIGLQSARQAALTMWYELDKVNITEKFCVNKEDLSLQCNGKCHLTKVLAQQEEGDAETPKTPVTEERVSFTAIVEQVPILNFTNSENSNQKMANYQFSYFFEPTFFIFHPPPKEA